MGWALCPMLGLGKIAGLAEKVIQGWAKWETPKETNA
jgi:hypothetical protein